MRPLQLIALYCYVCHCYDTSPVLHDQRQSNNARPAFTDQELLTIYLFGLLQHQLTMRTTYDYIRDHWASWFPHLPSYQAVNCRLNQLSWQMEVLVSTLIHRLHQQPVRADVHLLDSLPIILSRRADAGRVAPELASKGYCQAKHQYYHGLKLHVLAADRSGQMPLPTVVAFSAASVNDLTHLRSWVVGLPAGVIVADKAYCSAPLRTQLAQTATSLLTPIKLAKGQRRLDSASRLYNRYISSVRQPIESLFAWLVARTGLQDGSRIRSTAGAVLHCMGRLAAGLYILAFYP